MFGFSSRTAYSGKEAAGDKQLSFQQRLSQGLQRAGEILTVVGPTPIKSLRAALIAGDEEKAMSIYTTERGGKTLEEDLHPSMPFPTKKFQVETPLHLAAEAALGKLIEVFLEHGGNPNFANGREETCLHSICLHPDNRLLRLEVMNSLLLWRSTVGEDGEEPESVSVNHVDIDGNAAVHYASLNGLAECVDKLISSGAIISIVNKAQRTCCELADAQGHSELAGALELALVFQPVDSSMEAFDQTELLAFQNQTRHPLLALDCQSMKQEDVSIVIDEMLNDFCGFSGETLNRTESLLETFSWDPYKLKREFQRSTADTYKSALIEPVCVRPYEMDLGPWDSENSPCNIAGNKVQSDEVMNDNYTGRSYDGADMSYLRLDFEPKEHIDKIPNPEICKKYSKSSETKTEYGSDEEDDSSKNTVFESSPCSVCQEMMLRPVPAWAALLSRTSPQSETSTGVNENGRNGIHGIDDSESLKGWSSTPYNPTKNISPQGNLSRNGFGSNSSNYVGIGTNIACSSASVPSTVPDDDVSVKSSPGCPPHLEQRALQCQSGHTFCIACWSAYTTLQVKEQGAYALRCPGFKCGEVLDMQWAPVLLKPDLVAMLKNQRIKHVVDCCPNLKWCAHEHCDQVIRFDNDGLNLKENGSNIRLEEPWPQMLVCSSQHAFCMPCGGEAHGPCNCEDWKRWQKKLTEEMLAAGAILGGAKAGEDIANALWVAANTKKCPRCSTAIEKDEGCNHMSCRKCRYEFCWICMTDWALHSNNTGGYFQCNRFEASAAKVEGEDEGNPDDDPSGTRRFAEDRGSAHIESLRTRGRAQKTARFIHHFTRFQAHGDSGALEIKMHRDTIIRIENGLRATAEGNLKWLQGPRVPVPLVEPKIQEVSPFLPSKKVECPAQLKSAGLPLTSFNFPSLSLLATPGKGKYSEPVTEDDEHNMPHRPISMPSTPTSSSPSSSKEFGSRNLKTPNREDGTPTSPPERRGLFGTIFSSRKFLLPEGDYHRERSNSKASIASSSKDSETVGSPHNDRDSDKSDRIYERSERSEKSGKILKDMDKEKEKEKGTKSRTLKSAWSMLLPVSASKRSSNSSKKASTDEVNIEHDCNVEKTIYEPFSSSVEFLNLGFQELVKCRQILRGSFAYAFYAYSDEDDPDVTRASSHSRHVMKKHRGRRESRRQTFELIQSDLELFTEMLSDVVARKRLRAAKNQIVQATRTARSKRVELEQVIFAFAVSDAQSAEDHKSGAGRGAEAMYRRGSGSGLPQLYDSNSNMYSGDDLSEETIAALIAQLETAERADATDGNEAAPWAEGVALGGSDLRILLLQQLNAIGQMRAGGGVGNGGATRVGPGGGTAIDATDAAIDAAFGVETDPHRSRGARGSDGTDGPGPRMSRRARDFERAMRRERLRDTIPEGGGPQRVSNGFGDEILEEGEEEGGGGGYMSQRDRAQMRAVSLNDQAEETAELNMAILLSLRMSQGGGGVGPGLTGQDGVQLSGTRTVNAGLDVPMVGGIIQSDGTSQIEDPAHALELSEMEIAAVQALEEASSAEPSEHDISFLVAMGFERSRVISSLKSFGNSIELATDSLLFEA